MTLTLLILLPLVGALAVALIPKRRTELVFPVAIGVSILPLAASLWILVNFVSGESAFQFTEDYVLSEAFGFGWRLGIDGISLFMVVLTGILMRSPLRDRSPSARSSSWWQCWCSRPD